MSPLDHRLAVRRARRRAIDAARDEHDIAGRTDAELCNLLSDRNAVVVLAAQEELSSRRYLATWGTAHLGERHRGITVRPVSEMTMARPRRPINETKFARALALWRAGALSFRSAARFVGISVDMLRTRTPEYVEVNARHSAAVNKRTRDRRAAARFEAAP